MTKTTAIAKMTSRYGTIEAAREEYKRLAPQASSLRGTHLAVTPNGTLSILARCMFHDLEAGQLYWF
jgi:hypothetical protein